MNTAVIDADIDDAELAVHLFAAQPGLFGGIILRGDTPVREAMVDHLRAAMTRAHELVARVPVSVDSERLLGGIDLTATLASGRSVRRSGLIDDCAGGAVIVPMAERLAVEVAAPIALAIDSGNLAAILLDDAEDPDEGPPMVLGERIAFHCDVAGLRSFAADNRAGAVAIEAVAALDDAQRTSLASMSCALGVSSARGLLFAERAARAHASLAGRYTANDEDIAVAVRLVLAPRATQVPQADPAPPPEPQAESDAPPIDEADEERPNLDDMQLDDILLEAALAAIPLHVLDGIAGLRRGARGQGGKAGEKQKSSRRGRPLGARAGIPGNGKRLALIDSLRAAAPWQTIRRRAAAAGDDRVVHIRKSDLRIRHYQQRATTLTIFAVDASGSSALSRLAEAKGAVELMLAQAYVKRSQVALIAFRQAAAEVLLPPTRSLTRARRALAALPGGGGTPLAAGLIAAQQLADAAQRSGSTPVIALLTDGKGNVAMDGTANRAVAMEEAMAAARSISAIGLHSIVIDISPRPRPEAADLAVALGGRYLPLPQAQSAAMVAAIESVGAP